MMRITPLLLFVAAAISGCSTSGSATSESFTQFAAGHQNLVCKSVAIAEPVIDTTGASNPSVTATRDKLVQIFMQLGYKVESNQPSIFGGDSVCVVNSTFWLVGSFNRTITLSIEDPLLDEIIYTADISVRGSQDELLSAIGNALRPDLAR